MPPLSTIAFYGILDTGYVPEEDWVAKYDALAAGGAGIVQIRAKSETRAQRARLLEAVLGRRACAPRPDQLPHLVVNDDIDLCLAYPALGLHVGQDDLPATEARQRIGPNRILGLSTHSPEQALAAMQLGPRILSYFAVGPVFSTPTKPDYAPVGLELVRFVANQRPELPFFCIGGIKRSNIHQVREAGAERIVTVSDALCDPDTAAAVRRSIELLTA